jgi:hypothetical protein
MQERKSLSLAEGLTIEEAQSGVFVLVIGDKMVLQ